jgi:hypothetical protein
VRSSRRLVLLVALLALALAAIDATGALNGLLYATPLLVIGALLINQRFIGEERILARYRALPRPRLRAAKQRWTSTPERALTSALERAPWTLRGPPACAAL